MSAVLLHFLIYLSVSSHSLAAANTCRCTTPDTIPDGFVAKKQTGSQVNLYYVRRVNATGPTIVLLHGWPQNWASWSSVMPLLPASADVIAVNMRGTAPSDAPLTGYTKSTMARDVAALLDSLGISKVHLVGHDIGGMVFYAFARLFPERALTFTFIDAVIPGTPIFDSFNSDPLGWHFGFNAAPEFPEALTTGREDFFYPQFMRDVAGSPDALTPQEIEVTVKAYSVPSTARAGFEWYRAFAEDAEENEKFAEAGKMKTPVLGINGGRLVPGPYVAEMFEPLAENVEGAVLDAGHWIPEERPEEIVSLIADFVGI